MLSQYTQEQEFTFEISGKKITTTHNPILGKRNSLFDVLKTKSNIYGIQTDITLLQAELSIADLNNEKMFQKIINDENSENIIKLLNYIYLQNNFYFLFLCFYHKMPIVRKTAFTLLCNGFEVNPLIVSFIQSAFDLTDPHQALVFSAKFKQDCLSYLNREVVRWLTSLHQQTKNNKIWQRYNIQEINFAKEAQKKTVDTKEESIVSEAVIQPINTFATDLIFKWLLALPNKPNEIQGDNIASKTDKGFALKNKWLNANSRVKTAHKFLERIFEKWDENKEAEFNKAFLAFLSEMTLFDRHIFFIYAASSEQKNIMTISHKYLTDISTIKVENILTNQKDAQEYVKAIIQSKNYGEAKNKQLYYNVINDYFVDLIIQLKEVEDIFIPIKNENDCNFALPIIETVTKVQVRKLSYPHQKGFFKSFHFETGKPSKRFSQMIKTEPSSALEIQGISGIAIVLGENKTRATTLPLRLPDYEFKSRIDFKPSNKFDLKYFKVNKSRLASKKEKTLEDIFGETSIGDEEKEESTLEQILNNKINKEKPR